MDVSLLQRGGMAQYWADARFSSIKQPAPSGSLICEEFLVKSTTALSFVRVFLAMQYSEQGIRCAWRDEAAFRQELVLVLLLAPLTLWLELPKPDTVLLLALMGLVLVAELLNSGLEAVVDIVTPDFNVLAGKAKDCGSAAVFLSLLILGGAWLTLAGPTLWMQLVR